MTRRSYADVFISYARKDRAVAQLLAQALVAGGRSVWWDREIVAGKDFAAVIAAELARAKAVVVLWTPSSVLSNWVRDEAQAGMARGVLVPVLLGVAEAPIGYRSLQTVDLTGWHGGPHPGLAELGRALGQVAVPVDLTSAASDRPGWLRWVGVATLALLVMLACVWLLMALTRWSYGE
jgi:hypothetical protein